MKRNVYPYNQEYILLYYEIEFLLSLVHPSFSTDQSADGITAAWRTSCSKPPDLSWQQTVADQKPDQDKCEPAAGSAACVCVESGACEDVYLPPSSTPGATHLCGGLSRALPRVSVTLIILLVFLPSEQAGMLKSCSSRENTDR